MDAVTGADDIIPAPGFTCILAPRGSGSAEAASVFSFHNKVETPTNKTQALVLRTDLPCKSVPQCRSELRGVEIALVWIEARIRDFLARDFNTGVEVDHE